MAYKYYVYYDGCKVFARKDDLEPIEIAEYATAQEAHDYVQSIINPEGRSADSYGYKGFLSEEFQAKIEGNCAEVVINAYRNV